MLQIDERRVGDCIEPIYATHCPWKDVSELSVYLNGLYAHYKNGFSFRAGGLEDQPVWYISAMGVIDRKIAELDAAKEKASSKKNGKH